MRGKDFFKKIKPIIIVLVGLVNFLPRNIRQWLFYRFNSVVGKSLILYRYILLKSLVNKAGDNIIVQHSTYITYLEGLSLGSNISINEFCSIGARGGLEIGDNVSIAHRTTILTESHVIPSKDQNIKDSGIVFKKTKIGSDVWIGAGVIITAGIVVGDGAVIGANSVVTRDVDPYTIVAGSPAKLIRKRN